MQKGGYILVGLCLFLGTVNAQSVSRLDSLANQLKIALNDTSRVDLSIELGFAYRQSKPDRTYTLAKQAYDLSRKINYPSGEARALATMAAAFKFLGDYPKSLTLYNQARELNSRLNDLDRVAVVLNNTADLFIQQEEWAKGLATMRACFAIYNTLKNPKISSKSVYLANLAECFYHLGASDSAAFYLNRALPLAVAKKQDIVTAIYYLQGDVALARKNTDAARSFYRQCLQAATAQGNYADLYEGYYRLAKLDQKINSDAAAIDEARLALTYAQQAKFTNGILKSSQLLSQLYDGENNTEALHYYKLAVAAKDSLYSQDKVKRLLLIQFNEREQIQRVKSAKTAYDNQVRFTVLISMLSVLTGIAFLLFRNNRQKQRANRALTAKNEEIEQTVAQLKTAQVALAARNAENELLLKEVHHRVKNNLEVVSSLLALQSARNSDPNVQAAMQASQNRVQSMSILHQKLYQGEQLATIEMRDYFVNLSGSILDAFDAHERVTIECPMPELTMDIDMAIPIGLIINELMTNSLKYAFADRDNNTIRISLTHADDDGYFLLQVADNGIGKTAGSTAQGTGFGTELVELLTRQLDGTLTYENQHGTLVRLLFRKPPPGQRPNGER